MPTIKNILTQAMHTLVNCDSPLLDAEVLLAWQLGKSRSYLRAWCDNELTTEQLNNFESLIQQRLKGVPIAYLTGKREFWSREFIITPDVLIPRPETELLIELSLTLINDNNFCNILDLGTGSGIIAITLAAECPLIQVTAVDYSLSTLNIAEKNAKLNQINNISFYHSDWFNAIPKQTFNIIISNPPYIANDDKHLTQGDVRFEPRSALISAQNGLNDIDIITATAPNYLVNHGYLLVEHGYNQKEAVQNIFLKYGYVNIKTYHDLAELPRVTIGQFKKML